MHHLKQTVGQFGLINHLVGLLPSFYVLCLSKSRSHLSILIHLDLDLLRIWFGIFGKSQVLQRSLCRPSEAKVRTSFWASEELNKGHEGI